MNDDDKKTGTAVSLLNSQETVDQIQKEVMDEFITSDREVYKAGLRSLLVHQQKLEQQKASIDAEIAHLALARDALTEAFKNGSLHSVSDARGVVRKVKKELEKEFVSGYSDIDDDFS